MSVIIRLQNLPWSANALDIRNFFRGLSIPEGGVHIVGGELGDAFIAFSTDEDARQGMMLNGGKIKEIQVKLLLSSRSEMHKVIEAARQSVPILSLTATPAPAPPVVPAIVPPTPTPPAITPFSAALGTNPLSNFGIPGIGNPQEIPQPAVIEIPPPMASPTIITPDDDDDKLDKSRKQDNRRRTRSRSRSRDRDRKDRKRDRRDRSRSRDRRRRDRSRSRDRRDRKRDRKDRSRSRDRMSPRRSRDKRIERKSPVNASQERSLDSSSDFSVNMNQNKFPRMPPKAISPQMPMQPAMMQNGPPGPPNLHENRFDPALAETFNKLQELGKKRNPNAFQGDQQNGNRFSSNRGGGNAPRGGGSFRRDRPSRFDDPQRECCVAIRNAPNHTSYGDVRRFFPFMIDKHGIKMINDSMGRRTGNIFVRFCDTRSRQLALQKKSNELKGAQVIVEALDDEAYDSAVDSFLPFREENDDDDVALVIAENEETPNVPQPTFNILKLTDLPNFVKELDIIKTFGDFSLLSIILKDCRSTRTKIAFVHFVKPEDAKSVLDNKERYVFGRRQPTIVGVTSDEYEREKGNNAFEKAMEPSNGMGESQEPPPPRDPRQRRSQMDQGPQLGAPMMQGGQQIQGVVPMKGGPVMQGGPIHGGPALPGVTPIPGAPQLQPQAPFFPNPQFQGQQQNFAGAFPSPQFGAFPVRHGAVAQGPRPTGNNWPVRPAFQGEQIPGGPIPNPHVLSVDMENDVLDCVLMKGLPQAANDRSIVTFFSDTGAVPARIHIMLDPNGTPSGECYCEFRSTQEAMQAVAKHGQKIEDCRVDIELVSKRVVEEALESPKDPEARREGLLGNGPAQFFEPQRGGFAPRGSFRGRGFDRGGFNRGGFDQGRGGFDEGRGGFDEGRGGFGQRGGYRGRGAWLERGRGPERGRGRGFGRGRGRGGFDGGRGGFDGGRERVEDEPDPALEDFGSPGCVVSMENVPFRASIDDILAFFEDFELSQDDVIRRYNERGQPTGDARVAFRSPFDAQRAVSTRNLSTIHERRIHLNVL